MQQETQERVAAAVLAHGYLADLLPNVLEGMKDSGYLHDVIETGNYNVTTSISLQILLVEV